MHRPLTKAILLASSLLLLGCLLPATIRPPDDAMRARQNAYLMERLQALGQDGDWLVSRGYHGTDHLVVTVTATPLSHVAVLDLDGLQVIEAESQGVHITPLAEFIHKSHRILLIRPVWATEDRGDEATRHALRLVGKSYDYLGTVGLNDPNRFYCSELAMHIYHIYQKHGDAIPPIIEPGQMYLWGEVLFDSRPRHWHWPKLP